jgi:cytochrome b6-f complex iron-sulfur subunit
MDKQMEAMVSSETIEQEESDQEAGHEPQLFSRRNVLKLGVGALSALALLEFGGASVLYLQSNTSLGEFGGIVTAGPVDDFPPSSVTEFPHARFFLIRTPDGGFLAAHSRCTHLGCTVTWSQQDEQFVCPCHAAAFDFYGIQEGPPTPRPLDLFNVQIVAGEVRVDTSKIRQRESFESIQLVHA